MEFQTELIGRTKEMTALLSKRMTDILCDMEKAGRYGKSDLLDEKLCLLQDLRNLLAYLYLKEFEAYRDWIFGAPIVTPCQIITTPITSMDVIKESDCNDQPLELVIDLRALFNIPGQVDWHSGQVVLTPQTGGTGLPTNGGVILVDSGKFQFNISDPVSGTYVFQVLFNDLAGNELDVITITFILTCTCDDDETIIESCIDEESPTITEINIAL